MFVRIDSTKEAYSTYQEQLIDLYIEAFYLDKNTALLRSNIDAYFCRILNDGFALLKLEDKVLKGAIFITTPNFDTALPSIIKDKIDIQNTLYIAEVFIRKNSRGKGYGKQLFTSLFELADTKRKTFIIRVLTNNDAAINLYKKFSFIPKVTIKERKVDHLENKIELEKLYLIKEGKS